MASTIPRSDFNAALGIISGSSRTSLCLSRGSKEVDCVMPRFDLVRVAPATLLFVALGNFGNTGPLGLVFRVQAGEECAEFVGVDFATSAAIAERFLVVVVSFAFDCSRGILNAFTSTGVDRVSIVADVDS